MQFIHDVPFCDLCRLKVCTYPHWGVMTVKNTPRLVNDYRVLLLNLRASVYSMIQISWITRDYSTRIDQTLSVFTRVSGLRSLLVHEVRFLLISIALRREGGANYGHFVTTWLVVTTELLKPCVPFGSQPVPTVMLPSHMEALLFLLISFVCIE